MTLSRRQFLSKLMVTTAVLAVVPIAAVMSKRSLEDLVAERLKLAEQTLIEQWNEALYGDGSQRMMGGLADLVYQRYDGYEELNISPSDVLQSAEFQWKEVSCTVTMTRA